MTARLIKSGLSLILAAALVLPIVARGEVPTVSLSGAAMGALITAYKTLKIGSLHDAPLLLREDMVTISQFGSSFIVRIGKPPSKDLQRIVVDINSGKVISDTPPGEVHFDGEVPLPGFIAGQLISVCSHALADSTLPAYAQRALRRGAYYARIDSGFDGAVVALNEDETSAPDDSRLRPITTCVTLQCPEELAMYNIHVTPGNVIIDAFYSINSGK